MCKCRLEIRTPFCGTGDCQWPHKLKEGVRDDSNRKPLIGNILEEAVERIAEQRAKILEDFCRAYLASQDEKYFLKLASDDFRRVVLVERIISPTEREYSFKLKPGPLSKRKEALIESLK